MPVNTKEKVKKENKKKNAKQIIEENRKKIVEKLISNMEKGYIFSEWAWNKQAFIPRNAVTGTKYQGINRLNLSFASMENGYEDPRWLTFKKIQEMGYKLKEGSTGVFCEKWIWQKVQKVVNQETGEVEKDENGKEKYEIVELKRPIINYFYLYNASQIEGIEPYISNEKIEKSDITNVADSFMVSSECPIKEKFQDRAFYSPMEDSITLPPRRFFKSDEAFLGTLLHEMSHSTGHESRLNRDIKNKFGTEKYAMEELTAELSCVFLEAELDMNLDFTRQEHINYFSSWIKALKNDPNELYKVCSNASKSCNRLMENYEKVIAFENKQEKNKDEEEMEEAI
ncbi:ArdC family protein [uncultured Clostridium sp.]|uniref:ArdC family protein n=1 Tax=uncultured Clostridium sp. TaxID=59620 RepID=UPI00272CDCF9|nr:zincin-like metallopeptidase domain-containing protein [uncultured Clostridium sp.]